mgnify:CR=1 FL=1
MTEQYPGRWWHVLDDGRIQCDLCPRDCRLHEGQRGLCFVRAMHQSRMVLTTYGRSSGFCIDPIEKKPLNHFYPGSSVLSFGTAIGLGALAFEYLFDYPGVDPSYPLFVFVFPVALGIDYNIFLMTRVREETHVRGTRQGSLVALAATGGVITSAAGNARSRMNSGMLGRTNTPRPTSPITGSQQ